MRVTILGCGAAGGVPAISSGWGACDPANPRNRRRRPSILVEEGDCRLLVDATPDLRDQLLDVGVRTLSAVIITHAHADHMHGIDDLREVNRAIGGPLDLWAYPDVLADLYTRFGYCFAPADPAATSIYKPLLRARPIALETGRGFAPGGLPAIGFRQDHGGLASLGLRIGPLAYSTDVVRLDDAALAVLDGVETWIVDCFALTPHPTHAHLDQVLAWVERLRPRRTILTHMGPRLDYEALRHRLPPGVDPAYDGMVVDIPAIP